MNKPKHEFFTACGNGQWRVVRNKRPYYFGSWRSDPKGEAAMQEWIARKDTILAGLDTGHRPSPGSNGPGMSVLDLVRRYLRERSKDVTAKKLSPDTFRDYSFILNDFEKTLPAGAKAVKVLRPKFNEYLRILESRSVGPHAIRRHVTVIKMAFNYASDEEWIDPIPFGRSFCAPDTDAESVAMHHERHGATAKTERLLTRKEVRRLLRGVKNKPRWYAIVLLMLNTAMNPAEIARLKWSEIDFKTGRLNRRRGKTGKRQECYLWKRTRKALTRFVVASDLVFTRRDGRPMIGATPVMMGEEVGRVKRWNLITYKLIEMCVALKLDGVSPYTLRRTTRTLASHCNDDNAAKRMMGQRLAGQDQTYIKREFPLKRLKKISFTIYVKLFGKPKSKPKTTMRIVTEGEAA